MKKEKLANLKIYLQENLKEDGKTNIGENIAEFVAENNLDAMLTNIGAGLLSSIIGGISACNTKASREFEKNENAELDKLTLWISEEMQNSDSFPALMFQFLSEKGYEDTIPQFYNKISLDRRVFSRISSERNKQQPDKKTVFKILIGLELTLAEAEKLLKSAGYNFNNHKKYDMIIKYCVVNEIYDTETVDEYLVEFNEKALFSLE